MRRYYELFSESINDQIFALSQSNKFEFENLCGVKIGGWPTPVQIDQPYPGFCDLQIDMNSNYMFGDSGIAYLTKHIDRWSVRFECP